MGVREGCDKGWLVEDPLWQTGIDSYAITEFLPTRSAPALRALLQV